jgi:type IV secretion system protein VirB10
MAETKSNIGSEGHEPQLRSAGNEPQGVVHRYLKPAIYLGAASLVIAAAIFSSTGKKSATQSVSANHAVPPEPLLQDNTDNNVQDLKTLTRERQRQAATQQEAALAQQSAAMVGPAPQAVPCPMGQPCPQSPTGVAYPQPNVPQLSPLDQQAQELAAKERELAFDARFASNLIYAHSPETQSQLGSGSPAGAAASYPQDPINHPAGNLNPPRAAGDPPPGQDTNRRSAEVHLDAASGQPYVVYEGLTMDTVLMNRLDGDAAGPVKVLVSSPVYSHDRQHVLIPEGTIVLGETRKIGASGFGQQRRLAIAFHRMIMPDGYSADLDQFHGLDQIGEEGIKDKVNNHYLEIFGSSIALGIIAGAGEIAQGGGTISTSGSQAFTTGAAGQVSQSATTVLDHFLQIPPTITIREGHRIKVYFTQDMLLPAYEKHAIPQTF